MAAELVLRYERVELGAGESGYSGELLERQDNGEAPVKQLKVFEGEPFKKLLVAISLKLTEKEYARVIMGRTDRQGLQPITLDAPTTELLRSDPTSAIRMMAYETPQHSGKPRLSPPPAIAAGYDTIAETLGALIYCRVRAHAGAEATSVECPGCGHWIEAKKELHCPTCKITLTATFTEGWARVQTKALLDLGLPRYFLPRGYNTHKPWIFKDELKNLYEAWTLAMDQNKEKQT